MKNFIGHDGFIWWIGVVEDIEDPLTLGRCKVRCFGYHPPKKDNLVPTEDLPWALAIHAVNTPNFYGTPKKGDWVFGFFMDSTAAQEPAILGYLPAIPQQASEYFGEPPDLTRNFSKVTQKNSVFIDVNGSTIELLQDGELKFTANNLTFTSSNNLTLQSSNSISISSNNVTIVGSETASIADANYTYTPTKIYDEIHYALTVAESAYEVANNALLLAQQALTAAQAAQSSANAAQGSADAAQSSADTAQTSAENAQATATTATALSIIG